MEERDLDIVAGDTQIILKENVESKDGALLSRREVKENLIIEGESFTRLFPTYKPFFNEIWGKLYRAETLRLYDWEHYWKRALDGPFLPDTLFNIQTLSGCKRVGVMSGTTHKFYQYQQRRASNATIRVNSIEANYQAVRIFKKDNFSVYDTHEAIMKFLRSHGEISGELNEYMQAVLFGWFGDYYTRTLLPTQNEENFAKLASRLVFHPKFDELMRYQGSGAYNNLRDYQQRLDFCQRLRHTLLGQKMVRNRKVWWRGSLPCLRATAQKLDRAAAKLEGTILALQKQQKKSET